MEFFANVGLLALGSRLRALSEQLYALGDEVYAAHGIALQARWFPVIRLLHDRGPLTVGEIAAAAGQTHSAISQLATRLVREGWLTSSSDSTDRRVRRLSLTARSQAALREAKPLWRAIGEVLEERCQAAGLDVAATLDGLGSLLDEPLADAIAARTRDIRADEVAIVPFRSELRDSFYRLNADWLRRYFYLEAIDHRVLSNPEAEILEGGGAVFFAVSGDAVVGTCALMQTAPGVFELTKMAVDPPAQGLGIGRKLIETAIAEFERRKGKTLFLETNTRLAPAIRLYESAGFEHQRARRSNSHYQRADVYMIWRGRKAADRVVQAD
jgi:ribosomal protein S18 acetylase RimI-like enzyme/DNA-binding transcriptional ArsR family regulator